MRVRAVEASVFFMLVVCASPAHAALIRVGIDGFSGSERLITYDTSAGSVNGRSFGDVLHAYSSSPERPWNCMS